MVKRIYLIFYPLFIFILLSLPLLKHIVTEDKKISDENRNLVQYPQYPDNLSDLKKYTQDFNAYLSDQFGFRSDLIKLTNKIRYYAFKETTSNQITIGENGFVFYNSHKQKYPNSIFNLICRNKGLSEQKKNSLRSSINNSINYFSNLGYITDAVVVPTKSRIYPEYLPTLEKNWCSQIDSTWLEKSIENLEHVYYPFKFMLNLKNTIPVYLSKHFHWNGDAPYLIAQDIMKVMWDIDPEFNVKPSKENIPSDIDIHLKGLDLYDIASKYNYSGFDIVSCKGRKCVDQFNLYYKNGSLITYKRKSLNEQKLLIISDSFGAGIAEHFTRGFSDVTLLNLNHMKNEEQKKFYPWFLDQIQPTHILFVCHDYGAYGLFTKISTFIKQLN